MLHYSGTSVQCISNGFRRTDGNFSNQLEHQGFTGNKPGTNSRILRFEWCLFQWRPQLSFSAFPHWKQTLGLRTIGLLGIFNRFNFDSVVPINFRLPYGTQGRVPLGWFRGKKPRATQKKSFSCLTLKTPKYGESTVLFLTRWSPGIRMSDLF